MVRFVNTESNLRFSGVKSFSDGSGAKIEFEYVTRNYGSARRKGKICKNLQAHVHSVWICPKCIANMMEKWSRYKEHFSALENKTE